MSDTMRAVPRLIGKASDTYRASVDDLGSSISKAIGPLFSPHARERFTVTVRDGKIRVEFHGLYHGPGWSDSSG